MFGKQFASMYTGSMYGQPPLIFALMGYIIAHERPSLRERKCFVELNPRVLAGVFSSTPELILDAIRVLCAPDPESRSKQEDGRRLVQVSDGELVNGPMQFWVVNGWQYRQIRDEEERRIYLREAKRRSRENKTVNKLADSQQVSTMSTKAEAEAEAEADSRRREEERERSARANDVRMPDLKEVLFAAEKIGLPAWKAEEFFDYHSGLGWKKGQTSITNFLPFLTGWKNRWEAEGRPSQQNSLAGHPRANGGHRGKDPNCPIQRCIAENPTEFRTAEQEEEINRRYREIK